MIRTQIQLPEELARKLRKAARVRGVSMAEMVRRYIERGLAEETEDGPAKWAQAAALVGAFRDGSEATAVSTDHDAYLDRAYD